MIVIPFNPRREDELRQALANLVDTGSQVSVPDREVSRAAYRFNQERGCSMSHGTFTATMRPKDMHAFNERLAQARAVLNHD